MSNVATAPAEGTGTSPSSKASSGFPRLVEPPPVGAPGRGQAPSALSALASTSLAAGAFALAAAAFGWSFFHDPLGKGLKHYDFSTPKASLLSLAQIYAS